MKTFPGTSSLKQLCCLQEDGKIGLFRRTGVFAGFLECKCFSVWLALVWPALDQRYV